MKKAKPILFMLIALFFSGSAYAQNFSAALRNYQIPDYMRKSLDLEGQIYQTLSSQKQAVNELDLISLNSIVDFSPKFISKQITRTKIENTGIDFRFRNSYHYADSKLSGIQNLKTKENQLNVYLNADYGQDYYYSGESKNYLKFGGHLNLQYRNVHKDGLPDKESKLESIQPFRAKLTIGHGHGRVEYVEDMVEAIYILKELTDNKQLLKNVGLDEAKAFAEEITRIKNERFFDFRLHRQKSLVALVEKLKELGLVGNESISLYNTIMDYHYQVNHFERPSGHQFEYFINPTFYYDLYINEGTNSTSSNREQLGAGASATVRYQHYLPFSLKWQRNFRIEAVYSYEKGKNSQIISGDSFELNETSSYFGFTTNYTLGFYPNTRTRFLANIGANLYNTQKPVNELEIILNADLLMEYYISERFRLNANCTISYGDFRDAFDVPNNEMQNTQNSFVSYVGASLIYSIF